MPVDEDSDDDHVPENDNDSTDSTKDAEAEPTKAGSVEADAGDTEMVLAEPETIEELKGATS